MINKEVDIFVREEFLTNILQLDRGDPIHMQNHHCVHVYDDITILSVDGHEYCNICYLLADVGEYYYFNSA